MEEREPLASIIIPAYNEERRMPASLERITTFLRSFLRRSR